jgi:hypothetical protein
MFDDNYSGLLWGVFIFLFFIVIPLGATLIVLGVEGKISITVDQPQREELAACKATQQSLIDQRDVYCVKDFGRPNNTWEWVFGTMFFAAGVVAWLLGLYRADRIEKHAEANRAKAAELLEEAQKRENIITKLQSFVEHFPTNDKAKKQPRKR